MERVFDPAKCERRIYDLWEQEGRFAAGANASDGAAPFCIVIPPPNVTGSLHIGHALNNTLQDILIRHARMRGLDTLWQPGQDHAGIATQMVVVRQLEQSGEPSPREMGREEFLKRVWKWKEESGGTIIEQLKRLGASCDWSRNHFTMDATFSRAVIKCFVQLFHEGLIYRDKRLVNWDPHFETAISDLEVQQQEKQGHLWHLRYPFADGSGHIMVATTRPETMLGDVAVAVNPEDLRYQKHLGKNLILPLVGRAIPLIADEHADPQAGSGAVKITPAHDFNDFTVGHRHGLRMINIFDARAHIAIADNDDFLSDLPSGWPSADIMRLDGLERFAARKKLVKLLDAGDFLHKIEDHNHKVPLGDRSKALIEPYLTDQWFVDAAKLAPAAIKAVADEQVKFVPSNWEKTFFHWLENIEPWCISRQLWWGHQIPVWYGPDGQVFCAESEEEARAQALKHYGQDDIDLKRDEDVLDTWFSSAIWPFATMGWPENTEALKRYYPSAVLSTAFDIIFFWVARMVMMGMHFMRDAKGQPLHPFDRVYLHALVRDSEGQKMSKSLGNIVDPLELIDKYGADAVRFTLASMAAIGRDVRISEDRVEGYRNFGTKLWNAARFCQMNGCMAADDFNPADVKLPLSRWIVGSTGKLRQTLDRHLHNLRFDEAASALYAHIWGIFCDWHIEFAKYYLSGDDQTSSREIKSVTGWALDQCLIMLHPISPFITEEIWRITGERSQPLIHTPWPSYDDINDDEKASQQIEQLIMLVDTVRSVRAELSVPASAKIRAFLTNADDSWSDMLAENGVLSIRLARLQHLSLTDGSIENMVVTPMEGAVLALDLAEHINVEAERARLQKSRAKLKGEADGLRERLSDENFLNKAPEKIIAERRNRLEIIDEELTQLAQALTRMESL